MESGGYDPTLPLDFDGSTNMMDLPEVTLGADPSNTDLSATTSRTMSPGSGLLLPNLLAKSNSGRMSPVRGRTMKEYDQQITELKKENFSLKLRIYFLEERMQQKYGDGEDVFKTNIELKVNVQSLKKELEDKQELLRKASQAIETLTSSQQSDIDTVKKSLEEQHHKYTEELRSDLQKALQDAEDARDELESGRERMNDLEVRLQQLEMEQQQSVISSQKLKDAIDMKEREISALQLESDSHLRDLEDLNHQLQEAEGQRDAVQHKVQQLEKDVQRRGRDVEDVVEDQQDNLGQLEVKVADLEHQLHNKDDLIGRLEEGLKEKDKAWKDATNQLQQVGKELEEEKHLGARRDKTIVGLVSSLHKKEKEVASTKARLSKSEGALKTMRAELHEAEMASHQNMIKSLGRKEGELAGFREQLQQANQALKSSEEALEGLQEQLEKERSQAHCRLDKQAQDYQRMVEDYVQQLAGKDSLMAHMTAQLRAKDQQLTSLMELLTDDTNKGQKLLLQKLEDDLNKSSDNAQNALEEKQAEVDRKGKEAREARQALQDKAREVEQANLRLLDKQEELERLELRQRQQAEATAQLTNTLAKAQQSLEDALDRHAQVLQEKDAIVERLQKALAEKEHMVEELTDQNPAADKQQQQLRAQLREKDQLIQELQTDCVKASCEKEQALRSSRARVLEKEEEIQALDQKHQKELLNRDQEIQQLVSQLNKKDLQLQGLESRMVDAEALHREALHNMRRMLAEKEKTIEALVDSVSEKERLLRRSQQNLTEDAKTQMAEMDTLLAENSRLKRLLREKEDALQEELWQRSQHEKRETHHTSYRETVTHTNTADNAQVCRLLEEQIRETHALSELLRQDRHQVLVNLSSQHGSSGSDNRNEDGGRMSSGEALQAELSAVSALRQRLEEGVEKNQQLHRSLLGHTARQADHVASGESSPDSDNQPRLSILRTQQHHPQQQQQQQQQQRQGSSKEGDGGPSVGFGQPSSSKPQEWSVRHQGDAATTTPGRSSGHRTSSLAVQTSPFLTHTLFERGGLLSREEGATNDRFDPWSYSGAGEGEAAPLDVGVGHSVSQEQGLNRETSHDSILSSISSLSSAELAGMSSPVLRDLVSQLQEDLVAAAQRNAMLQKELKDTQKAGRRTEGRGSSQLAEGGASISTADDLQAEVESLREALQLKEDETAQLRQHLGLPPSPGTTSSAASAPACPASLHSQIHNLQHQVKDMNKVNNTLKQQIDSSRALGLEGLGPQQLVGMAMEIERLKAENAQLSAQMERSRQQGGEGVSKNLMQEVSMGEDVCDGNGAEGFSNGESGLPSDFSLQSSMSSAFPTDCSQELSRNTNRRSESSISQVPLAPHQWSGQPASASQLSQGDLEWAPRVVQGEGTVGSKLPPLAKKKLSGRESAGAGSPPLVHVGRRLLESQEQVKTLEERLVATEGTVRYMSQRLRHYRSLLQAVKRGGGECGSEFLAGLGLPRSQSESCLFPESRLSLSLSCSNLTEAGQNTGGTDYRSRSDIPAMMATEARVGQSSAGSDGQKSTTPSKNSRAILNTLNQHIKAMKERYSQGVDPSQPGIPKAAGGQSHPRQQEEDGGSNMSCLSSNISREKERREVASTTDRVSHMGPEGASKAFTSSVSTTVISETSTWTHGQDRHSSLASSLGRHGDAPCDSLSPQEMTFSIPPLGENGLDGTAMDNLTYSSFSESILPMGASQGQHDSALSWPRQVGRHGTGQEGRGSLVDKDSQSGENTEGGSSGDEATYDGNGTLHSTQTGDGGLLDESSKLKSRVMVLTDMNRTLREELNVYDTLCRSLGVQVSVGGSTGENGRDESCDGEMRLLQLHLAELKRLRARLEQLDTEAHNAVQVTSLLNSQHIQRIAELEAALAQLRDQLAQQRALSDQRQTVIVERERVITETQVVQEQQEKENQLLRDNLTALQECEAQRLQQQEVELAELQQQIDTLRAELEESRQSTKELEEELDESQKRRHSYDVKFSQSQQTLLDLETQLSKAKRRIKGLEAELHRSQLTCQDLESQLSSSKSRSASAEQELRTVHQTSRKLESELKESGQRVVVLETRLSQSEKARGEAEKARSEAEQELGSSKESLQSLEEEVGKLCQQKEELSGSLQEEREASHRLRSELAQARQERQQLEGLVSTSHSLQEECRQQQQRAQHYQERMGHYEQCMRDYQHRVQECECQVEQLRSSLQSSQSREQDSDSRLTQALAHIQQLQAQLKDAESRAHTSESMAHRADTLARTLEGRLRELEAKVKEWEERAKESDYELRVSQTTTSEMNMTIDNLRKEAAERSNKLKKRDAQLKKLVEEYKKVIASQKETYQLNQTLKTEIKLYESMTSQTEMSRDKKEELMRQLLSELSQTRRLAEDLISRLEHNKRNDSPASTAGPEVADGRPSPEPRDSLRSMLSETNILRVHTESHISTVHSQASSFSEHTDTRHTESPPICTPLSSPGSSSNISCSGSRPKRPAGTPGQEGEASRSETSEECSASRSDGLKEDDIRKGADVSGQGHLRSYSHPASLKYWRDHPLAALSGSAGVPKVDVDSDVRRLFAISGLEGYEKLKRENGELLTALTAMQARMTERLKTFTGVSISEVIKSVEYSTLRELQMSAQNLRICAEEEGRLISCFWLTQLPPINARGEFYDPKLADENDNLKVELRKQKSRYDLLAHTVREQQERLHATNALRKKWETTLYKQLTHTSGILERSKENFNEAGLTPPKSKSPRKSGQPIKDKN